ncbi:MAG: DUF1877 family protein [Planctomycetales bacterium]|nr:DUF1877 family protein [Planctomycetales bacterium]
MAAMNDVDFTQGVLMVFDRDRSKQLFGAKDPESLRQVLEAARADRVLWKDGLAVSCGGAADRLQVILSECEVPDEALRPALEQAFTGGRVLSEDTSFQVYLVRPDIVPHVYDALKRVRSATVKSHLDLTTESHVYDLFLSARAIYEVAADERSAIVYVGSA